MSEIDRQASASKHARRRGRTALGVALAAVALSGGAAFAAHELGVGPIWLQGDGSVAVDGSQLRPAYEGRYLSTSELATLQGQGKAMMGVVNRELACQGISLYFDTDAEWQAYLDDYEVRHGQDEATSLVPGADPCDPYVDSPRYVNDS